MRRNPDEFKRNVRRLLNERSLSQKEAAEKAGLPYKWMRRICTRGLTRVEGRNAEHVRKLCDLLGVADFEQLFSGSSLDDTPAGWAEKAATVIRRNNSESVWLKEKIDIAYKIRFADSVMNSLKEQGVWDDFKREVKVQNDDSGLEAAKNMMKEGFSVAEIIAALKEVRVESSGVDSAQRTEQDQEP